MEWYRKVNPVRVFPCQKIDILRSRPLNWSFGYFCASVVELLFQV
jgi:hypothetical protein